MPTEGPQRCARRPLQVRLGGEATPAVVRAVRGGGAAVSRLEPRPPARAGARARARDRPAMAPRISAVAVCCSRDSVSARLRLSTSLLRSAYDCAVGLTPLQGLPHSPQNFIVGAFSCWHRGHRIPSVSRVRIVSAYQGLRVTASGPPPELGVPAVLWGTGAPTLPRPGLGRQMGGSGAWLALEPVGRPHRRFRRVRPQTANSRKNSYCWGAAPSCSRRRSQWPDA